MDLSNNVLNNITKSELYFLIAKFLSNSPFKDVSQALIAELEKSNEIPSRLDWNGESHQQTFNELAAKYRHIGPEHLLLLCARLPQILDVQYAPTVPGILSLVGAGRQSLLRTKESIARPRNLREYCTRMHAKPLTDVLNRNNNHNIVNVLYGRQSAGPLTRKQAVPTSFYGKQALLRRTLGHLSAVYCVLFDRSGKHIITGADDLLVKLWSAIDGRLLTTFRGASAEITDIAVNLENTMLAAGSLDRILRVWDLQTASVIAVLGGHSGMITSVNFCPSPKSDLKYLVTTSTDGSVAFWQYSQPRNSKPIFQPKPTQYHEKLRPGQAQMICASFSPGGIFLAAGSADHHVRVYIMSEEGGPKRILEIESHTDTVDSIQWAHSGLKFVSGSKDGTALLWHFETQQWKFQKLNMTDRLSTCPISDGSDNKKLKVTMVSWDQSDSWIVTAVSDHTIKVWNSKTAKLHNVLRGHTDELYVLESHPTDPYVLLSAGHDGQLFLWDIYRGVKLESFVNQIEGQGHGGIFDAKWSPDGTSIAATDSHGHILMFGFGSGHKRLQNMPKELFFHTDYRPLIRDVNHYVLDEQTQLVPHLMPPPFLVDVDGNPYPPQMQRLVPGRENCPTDQLIPNIGVGAEGFGHEVQGARSDIDLLIEALANRHNGQIPDQPADNHEDNQNDHFNSPSRNGSLNGSNQRLSISNREGVRQSIGNWQHETNFKYMRRMLVRPLRYSNLQTMKTTAYCKGQLESEFYRREMRKRPMMINTGNPSSSSMNGPPKLRGRGGRKRRQQTADGGGGGGGSTSNPYSNTQNTTGLNNRTTMTRSSAPRRAQLDDEDEMEESSSEAENSDDSTAMEEDLELSGSSDSSDTGSSDYSDWIAVEDQQTLQPPKRSKRKPVDRRNYSPDSDDNTATKKKGAGKFKKIPLMPNGEIPEEYKPPEWLSEVIPKKAPYYPQMGDEVVYLRQGHERYFEVVATKKLYQLTGKFEPWLQMEIREHEFCKVIGIKYEIRPPRLCCLKLAVMTDDGQMTGQSFSIKYYDIADVLDFLVLKQTFDTAIRRNWGPGDRFRCMIDDKWWSGEIESHQTLSTDFPDSLFMCFKVRWDNSEYEFMSPWDLEPINEERMPSHEGGSVCVLPEEIQATLYRPKAEEWPRGDRDSSCRRIVAGLEEVLGLAIADPFLTPVDLNAYPSYAFVVEYPIDISTIKARFENHFYRRITSAQFDVRYLATNAEKFNEKHSIIVKHARIITDLCLRILRDHNEVDVAACYHQFLDTYVSSESESETNQPGPSTSTSRGGPSNSRTNGSRRSRRLIPEGGDWRMRCRELLQVIWDHSDAAPFRLPVDTLNHPDYLQIIEAPMDLQTVKEELISGNYETPMEFAKDMRLIFQNSRNYNTNQRSRIYAMTLRISELFEENIKSLISHFKYSKKRESSGSSPKKQSRSTRNNGAGGSGAGPSTSYSNQHNNNDDDDDDDDDDDAPKTNGRTRRKQSSHAGPSNGVSSSNMRDQPGGSSRRAKKPALRSSVEDSDGSDSSSEDSSPESESSGIPLAELGKSAQKKTIRKHKKRRTNGTVSSSTIKSPPKSTRAKRKRQLDSDDDDEEDEEEKRGGRGGGSGGAATTAAAGRIVHDDDVNSCDNNSELSTNDQPKSSRQRRMAVTKRDPARKRIASSSDDDGNESDKVEGRRGQRTTRRPKRYESDQSFRVDRPVNKKIVDSDSDQEQPRATRESARKKNIEWGRKSSDSQEDDSESEDKPQMSSSQNAIMKRGNNNINNNNNNNRRRQKKIIQSESEHSHEERGESSKSNGIKQEAPTTFRRSTRNGASQSQSQDDDDDDDESDERSTMNQPSTSTNIRNINRLTNGGTSVASVSQSASLRSTRSSNFQQRSTILESQPVLSLTDHTYGELGSSPSTTHNLSSIRQSIRQLSRHQRNADELDNRDTDPLSSASATSIRMLRLRNPRPSTSNSSSGNVFVSLNGNRRTTRNRISHNYFEDDGEENRAATQENQEVISRSVRSHVQPQAFQQEDSEDSYSEEDKTPLKMMASSSQKKNHEHNTRNGTSAVQKVKRTLYSDDEQAPGPSAGRTTRNMKRPHYNEDTDEEKKDSGRKQLKKRQLSSPLPPPAPLLHPPAAHDSDDENNSDGESEEDNMPSVSSRGRVRKISAKARGLFKE